MQTSPVAAAGSVGENDSSLTADFPATTSDEVGGQSRAIVATVSSTTAAPEIGPEPEEIVVRRCEGDRAPPRPAKILRGPLFLERFRSTKPNRHRLRKAGGNVVVALTPIALLILGSLPIVLYFTLHVSICLYVCITG